MEWEQTSLKQIPRRWSRVKNETAIFLKSIGLGIIVATYQGTFQKDFSEPKKITIRRSRITSFLTSLIHVIPVGVALYEVALNLRGHYVGADFDQQAWYQLAAKAHEILIDASLTSIALTYIRNELINGIGLPFGAFLGGLQFLSVSYLWSRELWSSVLATDYTLRKRVKFFFFIVICGIIAATAGPSSAILLVPRQTRWQVQPSYVLLNGTFQDVWPERLDPLHIPDHCAWIAEDATDSVCPSWDWKNFQSQLQFLTEHYGSLLSNDKDPRNVAYAHRWYFKTARYYQALKSGTVDTCTTFDTNLQVCGNIVPSILVKAAFNNTVLWIPASGFESYTDIIHTIDGEVFQAYAATQCVLDTIRGINDSSLLQFPRLARTEQEYESPPQLVSLVNITKFGVYSSSGNISEFRLVWTDLPATDFDRKVSGAIVLYPRNPLSGSTQDIASCTLNAGWGTSTITTSTVKNVGEVLAKPIDLPPAIAKLQASERSEILEAGKRFEDIVANVSGSMYPQRFIELPLTWLSYLNPTVKLQDGANTTVINALMTSLPEGVGSAIIAQIIMYMLLPGISSEGSGILSRSLPEGPIKCTDCLIFKTNHAYEGLAYCSGGVPVTLAILLMIAYCTLAITHTIHLLYTGLSSNAWDSAAEVFALAMNSSPTEHLKNTCSGIIGLKPFRTRVRIIATLGDAGGKEDHLEIVFGEKSEAKTAEARLQIGEEYGSSPAKLHQD